MASTWTETVEASWQRIERSFDDQMCKTPLVSRRVLVPLAPRKPPRQPRRIAVALKPRRLNFDVEAEAESPTPPQQDSGISLWSGSSANLTPDDVDKENRPLNRDSRKKRARARKGIAKPDFRPMRI